MNPKDASLEFRNLPLVEVVVRAYFRQRIQVDYQVVGGLHGSIKCEFPNAAPLSAWELSPVLPPNTQLPTQPGDLPGAEFSGGHLGLSVHFQPQLLAIRWRRGGSEHAPSYPRYGTVRGVLDSALVALGNTLGSGRPTIAVTNMMYTNLLRFDNPRPYFSDAFIPRGTDNAKVFQEQVLAWQTEEGVDLRLEVKRVQRTDIVVPDIGYLLTTVAGRGLDPSDDPLESLDSNHGELQRFFEHLISGKAKQEWGLKNGNTV